MSDIISDRELTRIFAEVGRSFGYVGISAAFEQLEPIRMTWSGWGNRNLEFGISDYLVGAPEEVMRDIADNLFHTIGKDPVEYTDRVREYLASDVFVHGARKLYITRERDGLDLDHKPLYHDIREAVGRIGAVPTATDVSGLWFAWADMLDILPRIRLVTIPVWMDSEDVPQDVFDYCLYWQACRLYRFSTRDPGTARDMERCLSQYPDGGRLQRELNTILQGCMDNMSQTKGDCRNSRRHGVPEDGG